MSPAKIGRLVALFLVLALGLTVPTVAGASASYAATAVPSATSTTYYNPYGGVPGSARLYTSGHASRKIYRGHQRSIDLCRATAVYGDPRNTRDTLWIGGHNYCGYAF